jgi:probable O-glycosylation ligase (exosortase A-associated)
MIDNNAYALALNMAIPLLLAIGTTERHPFVRYSALAMIPATALAMIFCFSRGGYLTLAAIACAIVFRSGRPVLASIVLVAGIGLLFATGAGFQDQIVRRTSTIADFEEDASASARILEWGTALRIFEDYPLFGVGPNNLRAVHARYSTFDHYKVTHNSFLQILVDSGLPAFILFVCLFFTSLWKLEKLRRSPTVPEKVPVYAGCFQIAFCAYFVGGFLLNMAYFDLFYELLALTATLEILAGSMRAAQPTLKLLTPNTDRWWESQPAT